MSPEHFQVLVAADDLFLRRFLIESLTSAGFSILEVGNAGEAIEIVRQRWFDLVLLTPGAPERSGIEICRKLRALSPDLGIVMIRESGTSSDEVLALDAGADDCITAPLQFREIIARLSAVLRRVRAEKQSQDRVLRAGDILLDIEQRRFWRAGQEIHLSPREFELLFVLMSNREVSITHLKLLRAVWGNSSVYDPGHLRSYIRALRRKIERDPSRPELILTVPWVGYRFHNPGGPL